MTELIRFTSDLALAEAAANAWLQQLATASSTRPYCVALSGGRIARRFFTATAAQARARKLDMDQVEFFWADERCVPPANPESNFGLAQQFLLAPLKVQAQRIHRIPGEVEPPLAAVQAEAEIRRVAAPNVNGQPILDLIFLGMGEDGHVASLFPTEAVEMVAHKAVYRAVIGPKPPPNRVTLGYGALAAAREVWVLASGSGKEEALRRSLDESGRTPLARLLSMRANTRVFTDIPSE
jgi:6-phosphogluconolactonase